MSVSDKLAPKKYTPSKADALKRLVDQAVHESEYPKPITPFTGTWDTPAIDQLVLVLKTTDALKTLHELISD